MKANPKTVEDRVLDLQQRISHMEYLFGLYFGTNEKQGAFEKHTKELVDSEVRMTDAKFELLESRLEKLEEAHD